METDPRVKQTVSQWIDGQTDRGFMSFYSLQEKHDIVLWCRIRQLLIESSAGFNNTQRDVIFTYMFLTLLVLSGTLFLHSSSIFASSADASMVAPSVSLNPPSPVCGPLPASPLSLSSRTISVNVFQSHLILSSCCALQIYLCAPKGQGRPISVLDLWALLDSFIFSILLLGIMYLKLALYDLRRSDIRILHTEYYRASLASTALAQSLTADSLPGGNRRDSANMASPGQEGMVGGLSSFGRSSSGGRGVVRGAGAGGGGGAGTPSSFGSGAEGFAETCNGLEGPLGSMGGRSFEGGMLRGSGLHSPFGGQPFLGARGRVGSGGRAGGRANGRGEGVGFGGDVNLMPKSKNPETRQVQDLLEQTARYIQQFERPPTVVGYPVTWEVLRYISFSLIAAIFTGAKGTIFRSLSAQVFPSPAMRSSGGAAGSSLHPGARDFGGGGGTWGL